MSSVHRINITRKETKNFLDPPPDAKAALFFLEGHYQLNYRAGNVTKTKFLTPGQIAKAFAVKDVFDSGWIGGTIFRFALLAKKTSKILSVLPSRRRTILLTDPRQSGESVLELEVPLPTLLLVGIGQRYYLWATPDKVVTGKSMISPAPFPNLDNSGSICFGSNHVPECRLETIESVWRTIFESPFNNHQSQNRCLTHPTDARNLWLELQGKKNFPKNSLIKTDHTVAELWSSVR